MAESVRQSLVRRVFVNGDERRLRAGWRLLIGVVVYAIAGVVAVLGIALVTTLLAALPLAIGGQVLPSAFGGQLVWNAVATALFVALARFVDRRTVPDIGLGGRGWWPNVGFGLVLGVVMTSVVFAVELATGLIAVADLLVTRSGLGFGALSFAPALVLTFVLFVAVGVGEEVFFRGYLMTNLAEGLNGLGPVGPRPAIATAAILTSAIFGLVHLGNPNATVVSALNITVVGVFLAGAYVVTDDLGVPIGVHVTWNFSLSSIYGFPVSGITTPVTVLDVRQTGDPLVTGGEFGPEAGLVVYLALAVAIALTWWWVRRMDGVVRFREDVAIPDLRSDPEDEIDLRQPEQIPGGGED